MINKDLTLDRYLVFNDVKELSSKFIMLLIDYGLSKPEIDSHLETLMSKFLGLDDKVKLVNLSTPILTEYANLLNKLIISQYVDGELCETLIPNGLERDMIIKKYHGKIKPEIATNPNCLNLFSIEKAPTSVLSNWAKQVNNEIINLNKNDDLKAFREKFLLTDYAKKIHTQSLNNEQEKIELEAEEQTSEIFKNKELTPDQRTDILEKINANKLKTILKIQKNMALEYMHNIKSGLSSKIQFIGKKCD